MVCSAVSGTSQTHAQHHDMHTYVTTLEQHVNLHHNGADSWLSASLFNQHSHKIMTPWGCCLHQPQGVCQTEQHPCRLTLA